MDETNSRKSVLLIDDDDLTAGSLRQYLAAHGCNVDVAFDFRDAEPLMATAKYDVVVIDPYLTGGVEREHHEMLDGIALRQPAATVIIVTGYVSPDLAQRAGDSRVALLTKPQSVVTLSELIFGSSAKGLAP